MIFSNENMKKLREKKGLVPPMTVQSPQTQMSKMPTAESMSGALNTTNDIETRATPGHWFFGIQIQSHPHGLILAILDCLKVLGFVIFE